MNRRCDQRDWSRGSKRLERAQKSGGNWPRVVDDSDPSDGWRDLQQYLQPLADNRGLEGLKAGYIASGLRKIPDKAAVYGIKDICKDDRYDPRFIEQHATT